MKLDLPFTMEVSKIIYVIFELKIYIATESVYIYIYYLFVIMVVNNAFFVLHVLLFQLFVKYLRNKNSSVLKHVSQRVI